MEKKIAAIILAAGEGKRMRSTLPKVCLPIAGLPMIAYPVRLVRTLKATPVVVVVSGRAERARMVRQALSSHAFAGLRFAVQKKPRGSGDAVRAAYGQLKSFRGTVLILCGDVPLIETETLRSFLRVHQEQKATVSLISIQLNDPTGYGRIVRGAGGDFLRIVEEKDAHSFEKDIQEVNAGIYAIDAAFLFQTLPQLQQKNAQHEFYLTDLASLAREKFEKVWIHQVECGETLLGVNTPKELAQMEGLARARKAQQLLQDGVTVIDPDHTYVEMDVRVDPGAILYPGSHLTGQTWVAAGAQIGPYAILNNTRVGKGAIVKAFCVLEEAVLKAKSSVGPFAHLRPGAVLQEEARVGNFVELKKTLMGRHAKANHLAYLGDTTVGEHANVGAGTITCNYDGFAKYQTKIGANAFIGSDTQLVAPVSIGKGAIVGAGTTVTRNVPADALAVSRTPQENKLNWAKRRRALARKRK